MNKLSQESKRTIAAGAALMLIGVLLGAFGAHALKTRLSPEMLAVYQTGVQYHLIHGLGLIAIGVLQHLEPQSGLLKTAAKLMLLGVVIFSGSLYILALSGMTIFGAVTPIGGLCFIAAWALVAWQMLHSR